VPQSGTREIHIGSEMARTLNVNPGDEVVVVAPAVDGSLGNDLFTVAGVYRSGLTDLDRTFVMLPIDALQSLMVFESNRVHEIAAAVPSPWDAEQAATRLDATLQSGAAPLLVESWATLRPEMVEYAQLTESLEGILLAIVFGMAIFGIANTMLMATYERRREFAVLLALGARPAGILWSVLAEAVALALVGLVVGVATALPVLVWWHNAPPDLSWLFGEFTMLGALIRPVLRVEYPWSVTVQAAFAMVLTAVVASVYPAIRAARLPPADTLAGR
jgi:ABC-type lipoprotein release transport system permease subunit